MREQALFLNFNTIPSEGPLILVKTASGFSGGLL